MQGGALLPTLQPGKLPPQLAAVASNTQHSHLFPPPCAAIPLPPALWPHSPGPWPLMFLFLQIWDQNRKVKSINLTVLEKHGNVYEDGEAGSPWIHLLPALAGRELGEGVGDGRVAKGALWPFGRVGEGRGRGSPGPVVGALGHAAQQGLTNTSPDQFGCLSWSHSETHLLYVAERKRPKAESFFQSRTPELSSNCADERRDKAVKVCGAQLEVASWSRGWATRPAPTTGQKAGHGARALSRDSESNSQLCR